MNPSTLTKTALLTGTIATVGCAEHIENPNADPATLETIDNLRRAGYPEEEIELQTDGLIFVGGDAQVSLEASREMIGVNPVTGENELEGFRQYRTTNLVSPWTDKICVDGSAYAKGLSQALNMAISRINALDLSFVMQRTSGVQAGCDTYITATIRTGLSAQAGFPSMGNPFGNISVGTSIVPTYGTTVASHVVLHELGHCVGLRHSDYYDRSISCGAGGNEGQAGIGAIHIPGTPAIAVLNGSVMNSCYNGLSTGVFSAGDVTAFETVYPNTECEDYCEADLDDCEEDFCYWDYNEFMCNEGCQADYDDCVSSC